MENGKGDKNNRISDWDKFRKEHDRIWSKKKKPKKEKKEK